MVARHYGYYFGGVRGSGYDASDVRGVDIVRRWKSKKKYWEVVVSKKAVNYVTDFVGSGRLY